MNKIIGFGLVCLICVFGGRANAETEENIEYATKIMNLGMRICMMEISVSELSLTPVQKAQLEERRTELIIEEFPALLDAEEKIQDIVLMDVAISTATCLNTYNQFNQ